METLRSYVNAWECDDNEHLNVQFYFDRFDEAARIHNHRRAIAARRPLTRHVRYHSELHSGDAIKATSEVIDADTVLHRLFTQDDARLAATALDRFAPGNIAGLAEEVRPRSLAPGPTAPDDLADAIAAGTATISNLSVVRPDQCDDTGALTDRFHIARFSNAAGAIWSFVGFTTPFLKAERLGTVAVEMKLTPIHRPAPGDLIEMRTGLVALARKTISFRHVMLNLSAGHIAAMGDVTALLMHLDRRRAVDLPVERMPAPLRALGN